MTFGVNKLTFANLPGEPTVAAGVARAMLEFAVSRGADRTELISAVSIDPELLDDQDNRVPLASYVALIRAGKSLAGDPALALHYAENVNLSEVSIVGLLGYASENLMEAFVQLNRYSRLVADIDTGGKDRFSLVYDDKGMWLVDNRRNPNLIPELTETSLGQAIRGTRQFSDRPFVREVHVTHSDPGYRHVYERVFGAPVVFDSHWNAALGDPQSTQFKVNLQPRYVFGLFSQHAEALLERLEAAKTFRGRVERALMPILHTGDVSRERVSRKLGCSPPTLYRSLKEEGVTFDEVLAELRCRVALNYLGSRQISVIETAYLVGFSDATAFSRAFKRWTGRTPRSMRDELQREL